jgi:cytochrome b561
VVAGVHIAAALYHHLIRRNGVLRRMWPGPR